MSALPHGGAGVSVHDRGFNYGDGVFETILLLDGEPVWWDAHMARLKRGCAALGITCPAAGELADAVRDELVERAPRGRSATFSPQAGEERRRVLKIVVTRGVGGRGYWPVDTGKPSVVVTLHEVPAPIDTIAVRWCDLRLSQQPALAGFKHLNRLENVLARSEWSDPAIGEGLLRDSHERVICATAANVFIVRHGQVLTPMLDRCGVAGVTRGWVMAQLAVRETDISMADIESSDEFFLTSSLRGILPVTRLGSRTWTPGPMTRRLQGLLPA